MKLQVAGAGKTGSGQSLSSAGSCLETFRPKPFVECQGARGTCQFWSDKYSFWLTTVDPSREFETQDTKVLNSNKGDDLTSRVSRCRVCLRSNGNTSSNEEDDDSETATAPDGTVLSRVAKSVRSWLSMN